MPFAPSIPLSKSAICMDPPLPLHNPVAFPKSSAIIPFKSQPFAIQCPCPLCVLVILSLSVKWAHTPTATASSQRINGRNLAERLARIIHAPYLQTYESLTFFVHPASLFFRNSIPFTFSCF